MKLISKSISATFRPIVKSLAILAVVALTLTGSQVFAQATGDKKGASVIYSSTTAAGLHVTVVDLGKSYSVKSLGLKFANSGKVKVYVVKSKPGDDAAWDGIAGAGSPNGTLDSGDKTPLNPPGKGEYLVIISEKDLGAFEDVNFTGSLGRQNVSVNIALQQNGHGSTTATTTVATRGGTTTTEVTTSVDTSGRRGNGGQFADKNYGLNPYGGNGAPSETPIPHGAFNPPPQGPNVPVTSN